MAFLHYGKSIVRRTSMHHPVLYAAQGVRYRKLEVILSTTIDKLGRAGETVKVAPGHFRNHLMPKLLAVPNIDKFAHLIDEQRKNIRKFIIEGKGNELRDPVTKEEILAEVSRQLQVHIEPENLLFPSPLSSLGEYKVPLRLLKSMPKPAGNGEASGGWFASPNAS